LLFHRFSWLAGWLLIAFFILLVPANIYAAVKRVDFQKANFEGAGLKYLWLEFRCRSSLSPGPMSVVYSNESCSNKLCLAVLHT